MTGEGRVQPAGLRVACLLGLQGNNEVQRSSILEIIQAAQHGTHKTMQSLQTRMQTNCLGSNTLCFFHPGGHEHILGADPMETIVTIPVRILEPDSLRHCY